MKLRQNILHTFKIGMLLVIAVVVIAGIQPNRTQAASTYPYLLKVNKQQNVVTVYKQNKKGIYNVPVKAMVCSTGYATPLGTFRTPAKYRWKNLDGDVWGQYSTRINGGVLFHSVWYYEYDPSTLSAVQFNKLGTTASHGCVRVTVADAKWIYDNCPVGTTVTIYNSSDPGPLGKPQAIKIKEGSGWDPTDIWTPENPYNEKTPTILGAKDQNVEYGSKLNLLKGVTALSSTGLSITKDIKVKGTVDTYAPGDYKVTYSVKDLLNRSAKKTVTFTVSGNASEPKIIGVKDRVIAKDTVVDRDFALQGISLYYGREQLDLSELQITIQKRNETEYAIDYAITAPNGTSASQTALVIVDTTAPVIAGATNREIAWDTPHTTEYAMTGVTVTDDFTPADKVAVTVTYIDKGNNMYGVHYEAKDAYGNVAVADVLYTVTDFLKITGATDKTMLYGEVMDDSYARNGVHAFSGEQDITWKMTITIADSADHVYTVTYQVKDDYGHEETAVAHVSYQPIVAQE